MEVCDDLGTVVDKYAKLKAKIDTMQEDADVLKAQLILSGQTSIKGTNHKVSITHVTPKPSPDYRAVATYLKASEDVLAMFMVERAAYTTVKVYGR